MRAWTVDADDIQVVDDFDAKLLHRTPWIDDFLTHGRDQKFIVTATKGFGKTLLLKAKRLAYEESKSAHCLPENSLLDKPIGDKVFSADMIALFGQSTESWCKVWLIAIAAATLKYLKMTSNLKVNPRLASLLADANLKSVIDHFVNLLDLPRNDLYRSANETDNQLVPRLRSVGTSVALFIDSIDEYFNKHMKAPAYRASDAGELSPDVWYFSQMGLVEVAYQLRRINHHLKVFAAVRKEAFSRFNEATSMVQQYRGSTVDISYSQASLREIFANNIRREKERNLVDPSKLKKDPIAAFCGLSQVTHSYTREREDLFDYVYRHTLRRPRDFMTIGQRLSDLGPKERAKENELKVAVHQTATEIAQEYLNEISPYVGSVQLDRLWSMINGNIMTRAELQRAFGGYNQPEAHLANLGRDTDEHVFCLLFKAGLLGYVDLDLVSGNKMQRFLMPGERTFDPDGILPVSSHYLVHPALGSLIAKVNTQYVVSIDKLNVVGDGRVWIEADEERRLCVLRADIKGFGALMEDPDVDRAVRERLRSAIAKHAAECLLAEVADGDSLTIVDEDPNALIKVAKAVIVDVYEAPGNPLLRVAIDYGAVKVRHDPDGRLVTSGAPLRVASRIEPWVTPSEIWVTEPFKQALGATSTFFAAVDIQPHERPELPVSESGFNVKKPASGEGDLWVKLYRIVEKGPNT